jgi:predicted enzyme related to lactoylglutathione lyase
MGYPVVYFEIGSSDDVALQRFYAALFGWSYEIPQPGYAIVDTRSGAGVRGGIGRSRDGSPWATFYVEVEDVQAMLDKAGSLGSKTVVPVTVIPNVVTWAMFADPDGLLVGLNQTGNVLGQPPSPGGGAAVDWFEIMATDGERERSFYENLFGWRAEGSGVAGYWLTDTGAGRGISGAIGAGSGLLWATIYARVADTDQALRRAEELGGARVYGPNIVNEQLQTGAFHDPAGNVIGVYARRDS